MKYTMPEVSPKTEKLIKEKSGVMLDIGCGANKQDGFVGIDIRPIEGVNIVHDLEVFPYPLPDECVVVAVCSHVVEHINPHKGVFMRFMDEIWRIMKPECEFAIITPYAGSIGYFQDPTHVNPCNENTWRYFDPEDSSMLWHIYKPKPWSIKLNAYQSTGNMEVVLVKRAMEAKYEGYKG